MGLGGFLRAKEDFCMLLDFHAYRAISFCFFRIYIGVFSVYIVSALH